MKANYKVNDNLEFQVEAEGQKQMFKELSSIQEIFGEANCGSCGGTDLRFVVRNVDDNDYFELRCKKCNSVLQYGQHKKGGTLFPKRKDDNGNYLENRGWYKYTPPKK
jgi:hypothetical protein